MRVAGAARLRGRRARAEEAAPRRRRRRREPSSLACPSPALLCKKTERARFARPWSPVKLNATFYRRLFTGALSRRNTTKPSGGVWCCSRVRVQSKRVFHSFEPQPLCNASGEQNGSCRHQTAPPDPPRNGCASAASPTAASHQHEESTLPTKAPQNQSTKRRSAHGANATADRAIRVEGRNRRDQQGEVIVDAEAERVEAEPPVRRPPRSRSRRPWTP